MEMPQHRNGPTSKRTKSARLLIHFLLFSRIIRNPSKNRKVLRAFRVFLIHYCYIYIWFVFRFFWNGFRFFGPFLVFRKSFKISICLSVFCLLWSANFRFVSGVWQKSIIFSLLVGFLFFLNPFPQIYGQFPVFKKVKYFPVCWSVSYFLLPFPANFWSLFGFQKKFIGRIPFWRFISTYF